MSGSMSESVRLLVNEIRAGRKDLRGAFLYEADLHEADLRGAFLREADLCGANLYEASFFRADLRRADLCGADLRGADLYEAYLHGAQLYGARGIYELDMIDPRGYRPIAVAHKDGWHIASGCRWFTLAEALIHWSTVEHGPKTIAGRYIRALNALPECDYND